MKQLYLTALFSFVLVFALRSQVHIVAATGGTNLSTTAYTTLGAIVIAEHTGSDIGGAITGTAYFELKAPGGYKFYVPGFNDPFPITLYRHGADIFDFFQRPHNDTILKFGIELFNNTGAPGDTLKISGIRVKADIANAPTGNIVWAPTTSTLYTDIALNGATKLVSNFGTLSTPVNTSLKEEHTTNGLAVFPNPAGSMLHIQATASVSHIKLYNANLKLVYEHVSETGINEIDMDVLSPGIYFLRAGLNSGQVLTSRVIKN